MKENLKFKLTFSTNFCVVNTGFQSKIYDIYLYLMRSKKLQGHKSAESH